MKKINNFIFAFLILFTAGSVYGSTIEGKVTDRTTGDPLIGVNIIIENMSRGTASDLEGDYYISNLSPGVYYLKFSYIGHEDAKDTITINQQNQTINLDVVLDWINLKGDEVIVSAQAIGQLSAINQQLSADGMMNVIDAERIQELPDQNVAESIARLPGITISRNDGEGSGVGIRGLSAQYNQVQLDGVAMSSSANMGSATDFSGQQSRSVSLSNISSESLSGIEVYKSILPDMDGATLGGTVNMRLGKAPSKAVYDVRAYGAYNAYQEDFNNYKFVGKMSNRFFDDSFGVQVGINAERRNRGNDKLYGNISREDIFVDSLGERITQYRTIGANIYNSRVVREKQSINAIFDYTIGESELLFSTFYNSGGLDEKQIRRNGNALFGSSVNSNTFSISNALRGTHNISNLEIEWQVSRFRTKTETPDDYRIYFSQQEQDASELNAADKLIITPEQYLELLPDDGTWSFEETYKDVGSIDETKYAGKLDLKYPFFYDNISGFLKTGLMLRQTDRSNRLQQQSLYAGRFPNGSEGPVYSEFATDYNPDPVLNGNVSIRHFLDVDKIKPVWTDWIKDYEYAAYNPLKTDNENYDYKENFYAAYFMIKTSAFNDMITFIPGVRYEGNDFDATGYYQYIKNQSTLTYNGIYEERNAKRNYGFWLPMMHLKYKPVDWFDTRLAITKSISRPNYRYLVPSVTTSFNIETGTDRGDPDLKTAESWNYDLSASFYSSSLGLLTISGFYKEITNFSYQLDYYIRNSEDAIKYGLDPEDPAFVASHYWPKNLSTPVNTNGVSTVKGIEIDYQANLRWLPGLLRYVTFNINYTRVWSHSYLRQYSVTLDSISYINVPPYVVENKTYDIGFREGRLPSQPDHILNVSLGYDIGGFSGRVSAFFQGRSLAGVGRIASADTYVEDYLRYDMSLRYRFNDNLSILVTGVNLSSTADITSLNGTDKHSSYSIYGAMYDFGVQYVF